MSTIGFVEGQSDPVQLSILKHDQGYLPISVTLDYTRARDKENGTVTQLRKGLLLGKITASGKYRAFKQQYLVGAAGAAAGQKVIPIKNTAGLVAADILLITDTAGNTETRTIDTVDSALQITLTENLTNDLLEDEVAYCKGGAELDADAVILVEEVADISSPAQDRIVAAVFKGVMDESACVNIDRLTKANCQRLSFM